MLLDRDGRFVAPAIPTDGCNHPLGSSKPGGTPYNTLAYRDVTVTEVRVTRSAAARKAGCPMDSTNVAYEPAEHFQAFDLATLGTSGLHRCDYTADPVSPEAGTFTAGEPLTAADLKALVEQAIAKEHDRCAKTATRFTVVTGVNNRALYLETNGCHHIYLDK